MLGSGPRCQGELMSAIYSLPDGRPRPKRRGEATRPRDRHQLSFFVDTV